MSATEEAVSVTPADFKRLEGKVDTMANAVAQLVLIEDRQSRHTTQLDKGEQRMAAIEVEIRTLDRRVDKWRYLVTGAGAVVSIGWQIFNSVRPHLP